MKVVIIGGGQSGLVTCKTFVESGYDVVVLEKSDKNGLFNNVLEKEMFKWSSSKFVSGFSDFPIPKDYPIWMNFTQYVEYLQMYKRKFNLDNYILYNSEVINITKVHNNCKENWEVTFKREETSIIKCDKLIISTGLNSSPKYIELVGYTGDVIHTDTVYKKMNRYDWKYAFSGKKVLLIGGGKSALDVGHVILDYTNDLYYTTKRYIEWFPDWGLDKDYIKENKTCAEEFLFGIEAEYPSDTHLSYLEYSLPTPMSGFWHLFGRKILVNMYQGSNIKCVHNHHKLCEINETPDNLFGKYVVKRTPFMCDLHNGKAKVVYYPARFDGKTIICENGETIENVDVIVLGTGYEMNIPFIEDFYYEDLTKKVLSKKDDSIAFVGYVRPTMGSIANTAEMQSWWLAEYFKGTLKPKYRNFSWARPEDPLNVSKHVVIGNYYMRDLAMDMKIHPDMYKMFFTDFKLWTRVIHSTIHPMLFRLSGKKAFEGSRKMYLENFPNIAKKEFYMYYIMFIIFHIIYILGIALVAYCITKLINWKWKKMYKTKIGKLTFFIIFGILLTLSYSKAY